MGIETAMTPGRNITCEGEGGNIMLGRVVLHLLSSVLKDREEKALDLLLSKLEGSFALK